MLIETSHDHNYNLIWVLLGSAVFHMAIVVITPDFKTQVEKKNDFLTVQIESKPAAEPLKPPLEKRVEPSIPSRSTISVPAPQKIQPQRQDSQPPKEIVPRLPSMPEEALAQKAPKLDTPRRNAPNVVRESSRKPIITRQSTPRPSLVKPIVLPPQPEIRAQQEPSLESIAPPSLPTQPTIISKRSQSAPNPRPLARSRPLPRAKPVAPRMSSPVVAPINPVIPPQPVVTSQPRSDEVIGSSSAEGEAKRQAVNSYRRDIHTAIEKLLTSDKHRKRSRIKKQHSGQKLMITLVFDKLGQFVSCEISEKSEFIRLDNYYLDLVNKLARRGKISAPPYKILELNLPIEINVN
jgi:hypothetical protein